jgi:biotin carboxylase
MVAHAGVPAPAMVAIDASFELDAAIARLGLPLVIRGAAGNCGSHTHICESRERAEAVLASLPRIGMSWIAQEFVASATFLVGGVFERGRPIRIYAGEKVEQWPPRVGPAVRMRARRDPDLVAAGLRAFERLQWTGFASADFVRGADGYQLLEINPRLWGSIAAAMAAGVEMFEPFLQLVMGRSPRAELGFADGVECRIFPRNLAAHPARGLRELLSKQGRGWRSPRFLVYLLDRQPA